MKVHLKPIYGSGQVKVHLKPIKGNGQVKVHLKPIKGNRQVKVHLKPIYGKAKPEISSIATSLPVFFHLPHHKLTELNTLSILQQSISNLVSRESLCYAPVLCHFLAKSL